MGFESSEDFTSKRRILSCFKVISFWTRINSAARRFHIPNNQLLSSLSPHPDSRSIPCFHTRAKHVTDFNPSIKPTSPVHLNRSGDQKLHDIRQANTNGNYPICSAARSGDQEIVKIVLNAGAGPNLSLLNPTLDAVARGWHIDVVEMLCGSDRVRRIDLADGAGCVKIVELLRNVQPQRIQMKRSLQTGSTMVETEAVWFGRFDIS